MSRSSKDISPFGQYIVHCSSSHSYKGRGCLNSLLSFKSNFFYKIHLPNGLEYTNTMVYESTLQVSVFKSWLSPPKNPRQKPFVTKSQPRCCFVATHKQKSMHTPCTLLLKFLFHKGTDNLANISGKILTIFHAVTEVTISDLSPILAHGSPSRIVQT